MLAKQAWRLLENPTSLLSRVLKQRYFPRTTFLEAHHGHSPSLTWQGIIWGRELLLKGLRYKIGNGLSIKSGLDPWIPRYSAFKPIGFCGNPSEPVTSYILENREWDVALLRNNFAQIDIDRIITIPLSYFQANDQLIWHYSPTGLYTVKSGFHLAASNSDGDQDNSSTNSNTWWKFFWSLNLPQKVKIFAWKVIQHALSVASALQRRHVIDSSVCSRCHIAWESIGHALFACKHAKAVWKTTSFSIDFPRVNGMFKGDYMIYLSSLMDKASYENLIYIMWSVWHDINSVLHGGSWKDPTALTLYALNYISDF